MTTTVHGGSRRRRRLIIQRRQEVGLLPAALPGAASYLIPSAATVGGTAAGLLGGIYAEETKELAGDAADAVTSKIPILPGFDSAEEQVEAMDRQSVLTVSAATPEEQQQQQQEQQQQEQQKNKQKSGSLSTPAVAIGATVLGIGAIVALS